LETSTPETAIPQAADAASGYLAVVQIKCKTWFARLHIDVMFKRR
jgi:hypothetical protein